jgi:hypothetical protein
MEAPAPRAEEPRREARPPQQEQSPEPAQEAQPERGKPDPTNTRYERARRAFLRIGQDIDEIKGTRDQAIRRGLNLADLQDQSARDHAELDRRRKAEESAGKQGGSSTVSTSGEALSGAPAPSVDFDRATERFRDEGEDFRSRVKDFAQDLTAPLLARIAQLEQRSQTSQANGSEGQAEYRAQVRTQASALIPDLADNDEYRRVLEVIQRHGLDKAPELMLDGATAVEQGLAVVVAGARLLGHSPGPVGERDRSTWSNGSASSGAMETSSVSSSAPRSVASVPRELTAEQAKQAALNQFKANRQRRGSLAGLRGN